MLPAAPANSGNQIPAGAGPGALVQVLFPHPRGPRVDHVDGTRQAVVIWAFPGSAGALWPRRGIWSSRVHNRYARRVADGAASGRQGPSFRWPSASDALTILT
jgi:hypothetical protein